MLLTFVCCLVVFGRLMFVCRLTVLRQLPLCLNSNNPQFSGVLVEHPVNVFIWSFYVTES